MNAQAAVLATSTNLSGASLLSQLKSDGLSDSVVEKWKKVCAFDLTRERALLTSPDRDFRYDEDYAAEMEDEYRKFIFIRAVHPDEKLPMSKDVDDFWHAHVMSTRNYQRFIDECADGVFIHHRPTISDHENMKLMFAYLNGTMARYRHYFGEPPKKFWKEDSTTACCYC